MGINIIKKSKEQLLEEIEDEKLNIELIEEQILTNMIKFGKGNIDPHLKETLQEMKRWLRNLENELEACKG